MSRRYQKEIEEILSQVEERTLPTGHPDDVPKKLPKSHHGANISGPFEKRNRQQGWFLAPGRLMFMGVALLAAALVLRGTSTWIVQPMAWAGIGLFIAAYILFFVRPRPSIEKRWRGRPLETPTKHRQSWRSFQRWLGLK